MSTPTEIAERVLEELPAAYSRVRELERALEDLARCAWRDLRMNRDEEPGGWWQTSTADAIDVAYSVLGKELPSGPVK